MSPKLSMKNPWNKMEETSLISRLSTHFIKKITNLSASTESYSKFTPEALKPVSTTLQKHSQWNLDPKTSESTELSLGQLKAQKEWTNSPLKTKRTKSKEWLNTILYQDSVFMNSQKKKKKNYCLKHFIRKKIGYFWSCPIFSQWCLFLHHRDEYRGRRWSPIDNA